MSKKNTAEIRITCLPYCLQRLESGHYVLLNRRYKPIGFTTGEYINYADYPIAHTLNLTESIVKSLAWNGEFQDDKIYLYNDGCIPTRSAEHMQAYLQRLAILAAL